MLLVRMNPDLAMGDDLLKKTGAGNLFMVFGEPDVEIERTDDGEVVVEVRGVDVYDPTTGQVRSDSTDDIACWMIDTEYNGESFFVRHAYFTGAGDPYKQLKPPSAPTSTRTPGPSLYRTRSRPFPRTRLRPDRRQGHQPLRRRGPEDLRGWVRLAGARSNEPLRVTHLRLENWRNFREADIALPRRVFLVGPNASGKSNFLDAFRFIRELAPSVLGLSDAVGDRGGVSSVRCLAARKNPAIGIVMEVGTEGDPGRWRYTLRLGQDNRRRPQVKEERVERGGRAVLERPDKEDRARPRTPNPDCVRAGHS